MPENQIESKKFVVERYLEQIKILSALATALLISPALIQVISGKVYSNIGRPRMVSLRTLALVSNISFLLVIILSYLVYSTIVGSVNKGVYDIYRTATRVFSIAQFIALIVGLSFLVAMFYQLI